MKSKFFFLALVVGLSFGASAFAYDTDDFGYRAASAVTLGVAKDVSATWYEEHNFADDASTYDAHVHELSMTYSGVAPWLDLTAAYCHVRSLSAPEKWTNNRNPWVAATIHEEDAGFGLANKFR